ncbi:MAG: 4Fe-4S binding protein [Actinobacteria bacterium]|nr:4Fe-4S binding protein [Actinomycetota bacterium]
MKKIKAHTLRAFTIAFILLLVAIGYVTKFGLGNLSGAGIDVVSLLCPLGALSTMLAAKLVIPRAVIALVLSIILILVFGRAFCAWVCPTPLIQRWFPGRSAKAKELKIEAADMVKEAEGVESLSTAENGVKTSCATCSESLGAGKKKWKPDSRHAILGGSLLSAAVFGFPVFCLICPIGLTLATILLVMRLFAFGETTWTLLLFPAILILELVVFRKWCKKICPLGALISLCSGLNRTFRPSIDDSKCLSSSKGIACKVCNKACNEDIDIRRPESSERSLTECTKCRDCADACPVGAISFPLLPPHNDKK